MSNLTDAIIAAKLIGAEGGGSGGGSGLPFPNAKRYIAVFTFDAESREGEARVYRYVNGTAEQTKFSYPLVPTTDYDTGEDVVEVGSLAIDGGEESLNDDEKLEMDLAQNYFSLVGYKFGQYISTEEDIFHALASWFPIAVDMF